MIKHKAIPSWLQIAAGGTIAIVGVQLSISLNDWSVFKLVFPISIGLGTGLVYSVILFQAWKMFPGREGVISGIIIAGFGLGGYVFISASTHIMNPQGINAIKVDPTDIKSKPFDPDVSERLPFMLKIVCKMWASIILFSILLLISGEISKVKDNFMSLNIIETKNTDTLLSK